MRSDSPYEAALRLLSYRERTLDEMGRRLAEKGYEKDGIAEVLRKLMDIGLLDDERFARNWIRGGMQGKLRGRRRLKVELLRKGVPDETAAAQLAEAYSEDEEFQLAAELAENRWERLSALPPQKRLRRLYAFLVGRGFSPSAISAALSRLRPQLLDTPGDDELQ